MLKEPEAKAVDGAREAALWRAKGDALHAAGDARAGGAAHMRALAASTRDPSLMAAAAALSSNDIPNAERLLKQHLKRAPTDIGAMRMLAELAVRIGRLGDAGALLDRALELAPAFEPARFARALVLSRRSRLTEALEETDRLLAIAPDNFAYRNLRASVLVRLGGFDEAREIYESVLQQRPNEPKIWMSLGHVLKTSGRTPQGIEAYRKSLQLRPELGESWWSLANLKTFRFTDADISAMHAGLDTPGVDDEDLLHLHFALGKAYEDRAEYKRSFDHYKQGNALQRARVEYDPAEVGAEVEHLRQLLTREFFEARRGQGSTAPDPIFILGLPRAGSTLLEQILASHPLVEGTMELPDIDMISRRIGVKSGEGYPAGLASLSADALRAMGDEYIERTRVQRRLGRPFFIDKMPNNWLHTGFIHLILPNAKIIDARRHPMACCFSAWKQHFARGQNFSFDLAEIGRYYRDYVALMDHIDAVAPGRVVRVIHERLVASPEAEIRRLLAALGLSFAESCLEFHKNERAVRTPSSEQVRRPISNEGIDQWRNYEPWLGPLVAELSPVIDSWERA
ncbi:MAG: sulfotransferase [Hyphomonadaceae bacterium]|nr:sulfotransferase [Hyphomonadaceae bacterium]